MIMKRISGFNINRCVLLKAMIDKEVMQLTLLRRVKYVRVQILNNNSVHKFLKLNGQVFPRIRANFFSTVNWRAMMRERL